MDLMPQSIEKLASITVVGMTAEIKGEPAKARKQIRELWERFNANLWKVKNRKQADEWQKFGVSYDRQPGDQFSYLAAVEVEDLGRIPEGMVGKRIPAVEYARFSHHGDMRQIHKTIFNMFNQWLPESGYNVVPGWQCGVDYYEKYDQRFKWSQSDSVIDIFLPVVKK